VSENKSKKKRSLFFQKKVEEGVGGEVKIGKVRLAISTCVL